MATKKTVGSNTQNAVSARVARWLILKTKIPIWVNFGFENVDIFYDQLEYFTDIWIFYFNLCSFWYNFPVLVSPTKKNLATLLHTFYCARTLLCFICMLALSISNTMYNLQASLKRRAHACSCLLNVCLKAGFPSVKWILIIPSVTLAW
jgi:hypothetical protein